MLVKREVAWRALLLFCCAVCMALSQASPPAAGAQAETIATDSTTVASAPVLWNGGAAWEDPDGVSAATAGSAQRRLVKFRPLGYTYAFELDSASGAGPAGALAYGWEEANNETPPMGPGDTDVPAPALPYETSISHSGVISAAGQATSLSGGCGARLGPEEFGGYRVSLSGDSVAYLCAGSPPGAPAPAPSSAPSYLAISELATLGAPPQTFAEVESSFQVSGGYVAYDAGNLFGVGHIVVAERAGAAKLYEVPTQAEEDPTIALQEDGTLVLLHAGTANCAQTGGQTSDAYPAEWFSPASPTAHQLGCFYDGSLRPVGGQWVALAPGPGPQASLVLLTIASGASRTLAVFPNAAMVEPQGQPVSAGSDYNGRQLTFMQQTCTGYDVQFAADVGALAPGPAPSARCPAQLHVDGPLHVSRKGVLHVAVSCPLGCVDMELAIAQPRELTDQLNLFTLPASRASRVESLRLTRGQLSYLRRHRRVRVTLTTLSGGLGGARASKTALRVLLVA